MRLALTISLSLHLILSNNLSLDALLNDISSKKAYNSYMDELLKLSKDLLCKSMFDSANDPHLDITLNSFSQYLRNVLGRNDPTHKTTSKAKKMKLDINYRLKRFFTSENTIKTQFNKDLFSVLVGTVDNYSKVQIEESKNIQLLLNSANFKDKNTQNIVEFFFLIHDTLFGKLIDLEAYKHKNIFKFFEYTVDRYRDNIPFLHLKEVLKKNPNISLKDALDINQADYKIFYKEILSLATIQSFENLKMEFGIDNCDFPVVINNEDVITECEFIKKTHSDPSFLPSINTVTTPRIPCSFETKIFELLDKEELFFEEASEILRSGEKQVIGRYKNWQINQQKHTT